MKLSGAGVVFRPIRLCAWRGISGQAPNSGWDCNRCMTCAWPSRRDLRASNARSGRSPRWRDAGEAMRQGHVCEFKVGFRTAPLKNDPNFANNSPSHGRSSFLSVGRRPLGQSPAQAGADEARRADERRGAVTGHDHAVEGVLDLEVEREAAGQGLARGEVPDGVPGEQVVVQIVLELQAAGAHANGEQRGAAVIEELRAALLLGDLRNALAGGGAGIGEQVSGLETQGAESAGEPGFAAAGESRTNVFALLRDEQRRDGLGGVEDQIMEAVAVPPPGEAPPM